MQFKFILLAVLSGLLAALPWYNAGVATLFIAFVPLLYINYKIVSQNNNSNALQFWLYAFVASLVWHFSVAWWGTKVSLVGAIFALILYAFTMSLVWLLVHQAYRYKGEKFAYVFLVFSWVSFEFLQLWWDISWPWLIVGSGIGQNIKIIQWYEYTGVLGGTLWVLLVNILIWEILKRYLIKGYSPGYIQLISLAVLVLFPLFSSYFIFNNYTEKGENINVALLQPNIDPYTEKFSTVNENLQYKKLLNLSEELDLTDISIISGPETALHNVWHHNVESHSGVKLIYNFLDENSKMAFVAGANTLKAYSSNSDIPYTARLHADSLFHYDAFNSVLFFTSDNPIGIYHKSKLVAGVEKMPFGRAFSFFNSLTVDLGGVGGTLATNNKIEVFEHGKALIATPICYESVYGQYVSKFVLEKDANLILITTNDGWWKNTPGYKQHLFHSQLRAIELRRDVARVANTGISCFINQKGEIVQRSKWWTEAVLSGTVSLNTNKTFYAKQGDYLARISVMMFVLMGLSVFVSYLKRNNSMF